MIDSKSTFSVQENHQMRQCKSKLDSVIIHNKYILQRKVALSTAQVNYFLMLLPRQKTLNLFVLPVAMYGEGIKSCFVQFRLF